MSLGFGKFDEDYFSIAGETLEEKIERLEKTNDELYEALASTQKERNEFALSLKELIGICKNRGFNAFPDLPKSMPLKHWPKDQILEHNKEATVRIASNRHVKSTDQVPMITPEEEIKRTEDRVAAFNKVDSFKLLVDSILLGKLKIETQNKS